MIKQPGAKGRSAGSFLGCWALVIWGCADPSAGVGDALPGEQAGEDRALPLEPAAPSELGQREFPVSRPPLTPGIFPCTDCHEAVSDKIVSRELTEEHLNIRLNHGQRDRWCFDCHDPQNRDKLRLAGGGAVDFTESYKLCGQCHGPELRDWRVGVHGKRTGNWDGPRQYLLCVHCHDPHTPRFKPLQPMPPPRRPGEI